MRRGRVVQVLARLGESDVQRPLAQAGATRVNCRARVVFPDPGTPSIRYTWPLANPPRRTSSSPRIPIRARFRSAVIVVMVDRPRVREMVRWTKVNVSNSNSLFYRKQPAMATQPFTGIGRGISLDRLHPAAVQIVAGADNFELPGLTRDFPRYPRAKNIHPRDKDQSLNVKRGHPQRVNRASDRVVNRVPAMRFSRMAAVCVLLALAPFAVWTARNWRVFHVFEPLAPRLAADPGESGNPGWERWVKSWCLDYISTYEIYWNVPGDATTACRPNAACRTTSVSAATLPCPTTRMVRARARAKRRQERHRDPDIAAQLHRALPTSSSRRTNRPSSACTASSAPRSTGVSTTRP